MKADNEVIEVLRRANQSWVANQVKTILVSLTKV